MYELWQLIGLKKAKSKKRIFHFSIFSGKKIKVFLSNTNYSFPERLKRVHIYHIFTDHLSDQNCTKWNPFISSFDFCFFVSFVGFGSRQQKAFTNLCTYVAFQLVSVELSSFYLQKYMVTQCPIYQPVSNVF